MKATWKDHEDGYHRVIWYVENQTGRVIGEVSGSEFTREWFGFTGQPNPKHLGKFITEQAAKNAVVRAVAASEPEKEKEKTT